MAVAHAPKQQGPTPGGGAPQQGGAKPGGMKGKLKELDYAGGQALVAPGGGGDKPGGHGAGAPAAKKAAETAPTPLLKIGAKGEPVRRLQTALLRNGCSPGAIDGDFGRKTLAAVKKFQGERGLVADGEVGPLTWGALGVSAPGPAAESSPKPPAGAAPGHTPEKPDPKAPRPKAGTVRLGDRGGDVRLLQQRLTDRGFSTKGTDGDFGKNTLAAVTAFQRSKGLHADGIVGAGTWDALGVDIDNSPPAPVPGGVPKPGNDGPPATSSGDPVALGRKYLTQPPTASKTLKGIIPNFTAAGGWTNNCADFVSALLETTGRIKGHHINVKAFEGQLAAQGWKRVTKSKAQPGDVWMNNSRGHTEMVTESGGAAFIGSNNDRPGHQVITEVPGYDGVFYHKNFA